MGNIHWDFCDDDLIIVTSLVLRSQSVSAVFCPAVFLLKLASVKLRCELREK